MYLCISIYHLPTCLLFTIPLSSISPLPICISITHLLSVYLSHYHPPCISHLLLSGFTVLPPSLSLGLSLGSQPHYASQAAAPRPSLSWKGSPDDCSWPGASEDFPLHPPHSCGLGSAGGIRVVLASPHVVRSLGSGAGGSLAFWSLRLSLGAPLEGRVWGGVWGAGCLFGDELGSRLRREGQ